MVMTGSMGYDGSLDFKLTIPITNALIGKQGYRVLEGAHVTLPISGTVEQPYFNREFLRHAVAGLVKQAKNRAEEKQVETEVPGFLENILGQ